VIARSVRLAQASSSTAAIVALVAFNLVPLVGVLFWGWSVATILVLYWVENGIVGLLNVPKMLLAAQSDTGTELPRISSPGVIVPKAGQALFFLVHYGIFWVVHGVFVFALPEFAGARGFAPVVTDPTSVFDPGFVPPDPGLMTPITAAAGNGPDWAAVAFGAVGLAISRVVSFFVNFVGHREYLRVSTARQMFAPYGRLVVLHLTILLGAFVSLSIGSPVGAIVVLVVVKTALDLALHLREHAAAAAGRPAAS